jgi:biopolymer transport protein ExbB
MLFHVLQVGLDTAAVEVAENIAKAAEPALQAAPQQVEQSYSLIQMAAKGGWLMLVLLALSIVAIYIFGKKWWAISQAGKVDKNFIKDVDNYLMEGKVRSARALCRRSDTPVARMIEKGVERIDKPLGDIRIAVENVANVEVAKLEKGLPALATIAGGAPMIGFLGTVMGMVQAFFNMAQAGNNIDITLLSGGIYTAMITTVGGLIVGILAYFGYNFLTAKITGLVSKMEAASIEFLDAAQARKEAKAEE